MKTIIKKRLPPGESPTNDEDEKPDEDLEENDDQEEQQSSYGLKDSSYLDQGDDKEVSNLISEQQEDEDDDDLFGSDDKGNRLEDLKQNIEDDIQEEKEKVDDSNDIAEIEREDKENQKKPMTLKQWMLIGIVGFIMIVMLAVVSYFVYDAASGPSEEEIAQEQKAKKEHEKHLEELAKYTLNQERNATVNGEDVKLKITKIYKDGSGEGVHKVKNKDGKIVDKSEHIPVEVMDSFLARQKQKADRDTNRTLDTEILNDKEDKSKEDKSKEDKSKEDKSKEDKSKEDKSKEDKSKEDKSKEDKSKEDKSKEDKSKEDKSKEDKSKEDK